MLVCILLLDFLTIYIGWSSDCENVIALLPGKAPGEDEIRPEMLKVLTGEGILLLTRVCQVAWKFGKIPKDWQTGVSISILKKKIANNVHTTKGYHSSVCQGKHMPNALKRNAEI